MERYHMFKLGLAILFYATYCVRPLLGLRSSHLVTNQTLRPEDINVFYQGVDGTPGVDFPVLSYIPKTTFSCDGIESGYYADLDTDCQVFHICEEGKKISFLCPNGTIFEQADLICEWWYKVNCTNAPNLYQDSAEYLREDIARRKASRRISLDGRERNHGAVMRIEESASVSAQQNGRTYQVNPRDSKVRGQPSGVNFGRQSTTPSRQNVIQSAIEKDLQNAPQKRYNDADTGNYINNNYEAYQKNGNSQSPFSRPNSDKQLYTRSTTPSSLNRFQSNLDDTTSRKPFTSSRGNIKFGSAYGSKIADTPGSTLRPAVDEYNLGFPKHKIEITQQNFPSKPASGSNAAKFESSKVDLGQPKQKSTVPLTRNDLLNRRLEASDSDELQIPQETAAFSPNSYNSLQSNSRKFSSTTHPNHRPTYSDLKRPDFSVTKTVNIINSVTPQYITTQSINSGKPFIGSTVGANIFKKTEKPQQNEETTVPISTTENILPSTLQPIISSTYHSFDANQDLTSTSQPDYTTTISSTEGKTTKPVDFATVYGSFSRGPTTAAPQNGVEIKLGKDVNKVSIQLSKSLGGGSPKYVGSTASPLATDGFVRISAGLSKPLGGSNSQIHFGSGSGKVNTPSLKTQSQKDIVTAAPIGESSALNEVSGSTISPSTWVVPEGSIGTLFDQDSTKAEGSSIRPDVYTNNIQSTTGVPLSFSHTDRPGVQNDFGNIVSSTTVRSNINAVTDSIGDGKTGSPSTFSSIGSTVQPDIPISVGLTGNVVAATNGPSFDVSGTTFAPSIRGSGSVSGDFGNTPTATVQAGTTVAGSTLSTIIGGNGLLGGSAGITVLPNAILSGYTGKQSSQEIPSSVAPDIFISENNKNTASPSPTKAAFVHTTVRSVAAGSQVKAFQPIVELSDIRKINGTNTNSYRPNFYPTRSTNTDFGKTAKPTIGLIEDESGSSQSTSSPAFGVRVTTSPNPNAYLPLNHHSVEINVSQNDVSSTLSPINEASSFRSVSTQSDNNVFGTSSTTTVNPFGIDSTATTSSGFYVTRNSLYKSTTAAPFGLSTATVSSNYVESTPVVNISPNSGEDHVGLDVTLLPPNSGSVVPGDSLSNSETRYPRPFQKTANSIDDGSSSKTDTTTPDYFTYKISSARPFELPKDRATPAPTIPTPFTTARSVQANVDNMINVLQGMMDSEDYSSETPRPGLIVPPSAGPQTLHTLAQYFANALDGIVAEREKETGEELDKESKEKLTSLLTQMTMYRYKELFKGTDLDDEKSEETTTHAGDEELHADDSNNLVETPELRQLARNFSLALSSYLNDPDAFRKELETFRPTEPSSTGDEVTESGVGDEELLNFSDADSKSSLPPVFPTPQSPVPTWGYIIAPKTAQDLDVKNSLNPDLHTADSQSFVPAFNNLAASNGKSFTKDESTTNKIPEDHWTTSAGVTKLWQSALSINPALVNENLDNTRSYSHTTEPYVAATTPPELDVPQSEIHYDLRALPKLKLNSTQVHGILIDFVNTTRSDDPNRLQRLLKKLNTTEDEFIHRMREIESNPLTKRLILLLISECGANVTKDLETDPIQSLSELLGSSSTNSAVASPEDGAHPNSDIPELVDPSLQEDNQDARALQLLNSLYAIASKFGK